MAATPVTIGLDIGTSATKGVALSAEGKVLARAVAGYPLLTPRPGWSEQHPEDWWRASQEVLRALTATPGLEPVGLGLSGQMHGSVFLDRRGEVIRPALLWNDGRTGAECVEIERRLGRERVIEITGNRASAGMQAPKVLWLANHEPDAYARVEQILLPKDFVRFRLTGERATDPADASGTLLLDLRTRRFSDELVSALEIGASRVPEVVESPDLTGRVTADAAAATGLPEGLPVVAGGGDNACAALGAGVVTTGAGACSVGTSGTVFVHADRPVHDPEGALNAFCAAMPGGWHLMGVILSAGGCLRWFKDTLAETDAAALAGFGRDIFEGLLDEAMTVPPGAEGLMFLPYLAGERSPHMDPDARGAWIGLSLAHRRKHLVRALVEGVGFGLADCVDRMRAVGSGPRSLALVGGGARHAGWRDLLAAQLAVPLENPAAEEGPAMGAAILAQVGAGIHADVPAAVRACVPPPEGGTAPDAALVRTYEDLHDGWRRLYPALKALAV